MEEPLGSAISDYVRRGGIACPRCGSGDLQPGSVEVDLGTASQSITCEACHMEWTDRYQLAGIKLETSEETYYPDEHRTDTELLEHAKSTLARIRSDGPDAAAVRRALQELAAVRPAADPTSVLADGGSSPGPGACPKCGGNEFENGHCTYDGYPAVPAGSAQRIVRYLIVFDRSQDEYDNEEMTDEQAIQQLRAELQEAFDEGLLNGHFRIVNRSIGVFPPLFGDGLNVPAIIAGRAPALEALTTIRDNCALWQSGKSSMSAGDFLGLCEDAALLGLGQKQRWNTFPAGHF